MFYVGSGNTEVGVRTNSWVHWGHLGSLSSCPLGKSWVSVSSVKQGSLPPSLYRAGVHGQGTKKAVGSPRHSARKRLFYLSLVWQDCRCFMRHLGRINCQMALGERESCWTESPNSWVLVPALSLTWPMSATKRFLTWSEETFPSVIQWLFEDLLCARPCADY